MKDIYWASLPCQISGSDIDLTKNDDNNRYTIEIEADETVRKCSVTIPENSLCNNNSKTIQFQISTAVKKVAKVELTINENLENILPKMDAAIIITGHDDFKKIPISSFSKMKNKILIDTRGIIDPISVRKENIIFRGLGRGNS